MFHKMPVILLGLIGLVIFFDHLIPVELKSHLYALSLSLKSVIIFILPMIIFMLLFKTLAQLASQATKIVFFILFAVCVSNFLSTMISYQIGSAISHLDLSLTVPKDVEGLTPAWSFSVPKLIANDSAMFAGLILGILFSLVQPTLAQKISKYFDKAVSVTLKLLIYIIPLFIIGFVVKLIHDKVMENILREYAIIFVLVAMAQFVYIGFIYWAANKFNLSRFFVSIKNMLPAAIAGFGSMSSAAAMPLTIIGAEKNTNRRSLTRLVIPTTVNTHLIGDCFAIPIFAFAILKNFGMPEPLFASYFIFALYFVLAKFSVAAIPGGGILVMLPILEANLGFTAEMSSLITALYILFDPVITCANVCGNGAFAVALDKILGGFSEEKRVESVTI
jgi:Na+/H+-dicarboxylate symporter